MKFSAFGQRFSRPSGILSLMNDLGHAMTDEKQTYIMMGGGNPARIKTVEQFFLQRLKCLIDTPNSLDKLISNYAPPAGQHDFIVSIASYLRNHQGWPVTEKNICLTHGSQHGFFMLFNLFGGQMEQGDSRRIHLALTPEYIGYNDTGIESNLFSACRPRIESVGQQTFKYRVDFEALQLHLKQHSETVGALCASRPSNPTGNILTDDEIKQLHRLAIRYDIPLILDHAYGIPFPCIFSTPHTAFWDPHVVISLSLSKLGLPAVRTGIIVAQEDIISSISNMNAIMTLSTNSFGALLVQNMFETNSITTLCNDVIAPYYASRKADTVNYLLDAIKGTPVKLHVAEGSLFLWLWLENFPLNSYDFYKHLKNKGVIIVSGHYFFTDDKKAWPHQHECIRITYTQPEKIVKSGIDILAREIKNIYSKPSIT